ncbi:FAD/NAD(P)-binding domain-containing protein [Xylariaceae sp. FL1651]|nr:FAD/NAD(P)-binding domain-containing protein [Xylariaceae sp. FL1651]
MPSFRVIVLGAGPVGLFTAHALAAAGIDFVVLERQPEIVRFRGALIVLWPPFVRLMDQLGLYEEAMKTATRLTTKTNYIHSGEPLCHGPVFEVLEDCFGYPSIGLSRSNLIRVLYEGLPRRETRVKANAEAVNIETRSDGVRVHLADGSVVEGSMVIAADGVHSPARELIQRLENGSSSSGDLKPTSPMVTTFMSIFGRAPCDRNDIVLGDFAESHGPGVASQSMRCHDALYFTVLKRLDAPTSERKRFTDEELEQVAQGMSDVMVLPGVKLKEIWPSRDQTNVVLLHQEEGMAESWYYGRVVLVGDAAHKMTSVSGQGAMTGVLSATTLVNNLRATLRKRSSPSTAELEAAFARYHKSRTEVSRGVVDFAALATRFITWTAEGSEAMDRTESPKQDLAKDARTILAPLFKKSPILDFMPFESKQGTVPWEMDGKPPVRARL